MITLASMLLFLAFGLSVGAAAYALTPVRQRGAWFFYVLLGVLGASVFGFAARGMGAYGPGDRAGLVASLLGAMIFVAAYHGLRRRASANGDG